jgi:tetratricopeptide (TPR) repeat protein
MERVYYVKAIGDVDYVKAIGDVDYIKAIREVDKDVISEDDYYYNLGRNLLEQGKINEALESLKKSLELRNHFKTLAQISVCYDKLGLADLAFKYLELGYKANPRNDKVAYDFAEKLKDNNRITEAKEILESILSRNLSYNKAKILLRILDNNEDNDD